MRKFVTKYHKETRNGNSFWTCELYEDGVFVSLGNGTTKEKAKQSAINNHEKESKYYG